MVERVQLDGLVSGGAIFVLRAVFADPEMQVVLELVFVLVFVRVEDDVRITHVKLAFLGVESNDHDKRELQPMN